VFGTLLAQEMAVAGSPPAPDVWLYTPMALDVARSLDPGRIVYDVMDDLASFAGASADVARRELEALRWADVVFTGGRSLQRTAVARRPEGTHCFPSGVDVEHYAAAARHRRPHDRPVAGYVGVVDERLDRDLIGALAEALADWEIRIVGPVAKIDPAALPQAPNLIYAGQVTYDELPEVMAGFDVALMPFALNDATRSISPTKTLEYLAAGLPVVSTRVPDVVADFRDVVDLQDDAPGFAAACRRALCQPADLLAAKAQPLLAWRRWDTIAARMEELIDRATASSR
jgi:glycosyltransferase involved in cell wall biosynthesis